AGVSLGGGLVGGKGSEEGRGDFLGLEGVLRKLAVGHARQGLEALRHRAGLADPIEEGRDAMAEPLQEAWGSVDQLVQGNNSHGNILSNLCLLWNPIYIGII